MAAYDEMENVENVEDPWKNIIAKKKAYHNVRIQGTQKKLRTLLFAESVSDLHEQSGLSHSLFLYK